MTRYFSISHPVSFPPCLLQDKVLQSFYLSGVPDVRYSSMKRTSTEAFTPQLQETPRKVSNYLTLYVALNPTQFAQLQDDLPILPDPYSERFGLRSDPIKAAERPNYFMTWAPPYCEAPDQSHIKKYMICKIGITGVGYMSENNILQKGDGSDPFRPGHYRWHGPLQKSLHGKDQASNIEYLICSFEDEYSEFV